GGRRSPGRRRNRATRAPPAHRSPPWPRSGRFPGAPGPPSDADAMADEACRIDVWLWRARFFKTRSLCARIVDEGRVRLTRAGAESRIDKPSRPVKVGDEL